MRPRELAFALAQADTQRAPLMIATVQTTAGVRLFTAVGLTDAEIATTGGTKLDGTWTLGGTVTFGSFLSPIIANESRVLSFGQMRDTGSILPTVNIRGQRSREVGSVEVLLRNDDDYFGRLLAQDTILSATIEIAVGFRGLPRH